MPRLRHIRLRKAVIATAQRMNALGVNQGRAGNVSARVQDGFLITPSALRYGDMLPAQIVRVDMDGRVDGPHRASSEWRMHRDIYQERPEAGAVVHAHAIFCTALACLRRGIPAFHYMVAVAGGPDIRCAAYATFGTEALSRNMLKAMSDRRACLLANHGMICLGGDLDEALELAVEVETLARQFWHASQAGRPVLLSQREMSEVLERFARYGRDERAAGSGPGTAKR